MRRIEKGYNARGAAFFTKWDLEANDDKNDEWEMPPNLKEKGDLTKGEEGEGESNSKNFSKDIIVKEEEEEEEENNRDIKIIK